MSVVGFLAVVLWGPWEPTLSGSGASGSDSTILNSFPLWILISLTFFHHMWLPRNCCLHPYISVSFSPPPFIPVSPPSPLLTVRGSLNSIGPCCVPKYRWQQCNWHCPQQLTSHPASCTNKPLKIMVLDLCILIISGKHVSSMVQMLLRLFKLL